MKPHLLKVTLRPEHSFGVRHDILPFFYNQWHYHEENELVYIIKGSGTQFIGNDVHNFKSGDMLFVGSGLPHLWRSGNKFLLKKTRFKSEAYVIHFKNDCFGPHFFDLPENKAILHLLTKAKQGLRIQEKTKSLVVSLFEELLQATSSHRIILLLRILQVIADSKTTKTICRKGIQFNFNATDSERLNAIYQHIMNNFSRDLSLKEIAAIACLTPNSFCRYFKSRIKKSFSRFLIEVRIGHASKMLAETNNPIVDICYACGYNNFTNFYKHFKHITSKTPLQYRKYQQDEKSFLG